MGDARHPCFEQLVALSAVTNEAEYPPPPQSKSISPPKPMLMHTNCQARTHTPSGTRIVSHMHREAEGYQKLTLFLNAILTAQERGAPHEAQHALQSDFPSNSLPRHTCSGAHTPPLSPTQPTMSEIHTIRQKAARKSHSLMAHLVTAQEREGSLMRLSTRPFFTWRGSRLAIEP